MQKLLLLLTLTLSLTAQASPLYLRQDPARSRVVIVAGEERILMPDGRILPIGAGVICTDDCPEVIEPIASSRRWVVPVIAAGVIATALLWPRGTPPRVIVPPDVVPPVAPPITPTAPVPEPSTFALLALAGLIVLPRFFKSHNERIPQ